MANNPRRKRTVSRRKFAAHPDPATVFDCEPLQFDPDPKAARAFNIWRPDRLIMGKRLDLLVPFAVCWWHTLCNLLNDVFGGGTRVAPFGGAPKDLKEAYYRIDLMFSFMRILGIKYYCFHDLDVIPTPKNLKQYAQYIEAVTAKLEQKQKEYGVKLLWGTAALFSMRHFGSGAATSPQLDVFDVAAFQVETMLKATKRLGGIGYVLWGGREGHTTLWNTMLSHEEKALAAFLKMVAKFAKENCPGITLLIEPKFSEPCIVQYDASAQVVLGFLARHGLLKAYSLNLEVNHAELAHRTFWFEMECARGAGKLGFIDFNSGTAFTGWDTDQFPVFDPKLVIEMSMSILLNGGLTGVNFDAHVRRESFDVEALILGHAGGMDNLAFGLEVAGVLLEDGTYQGILDQRYASWNSAAGRNVLSGKTTLSQAAGRAKRRNAFPQLNAGRQEKLEKLVTAAMIEAAQRIAS